MNLYSIHSNDQERRLDNFLISTLKSPKPLIYRLIRKGVVRVNGRRVKPHYRLMAADQVKVPTISQNKSKQNGVKLTTKQRSELSSQILLENDDFLIFNKPAGMASQPGTGITVSAIDAIRQIRPEYPNINLAHRLDRGTSGCLMFCKNKHTIIKINKMIAERNIQKKYIAVLVGRLEQAKVTVDQPLTILPHIHQKKCSTVSPDGKHATTHFSVLRRSKKHTLVLVRPITGRMHQIRAHAKHLGYPIAGDSLYGQNSGLAEDCARRLYLHAYQITLQDPRHTGPSLIQAKSNIPVDFKKLILSHDAN